MCLTILWGWCSNCKFWEDPQKFIYCYKRITEKINPLLYEIYFTHFSTVSIVDFEQANVSWINDTSKKIKNRPGIDYVSIDIKKQMFITDKERSHIRKHKDSGFGLYFLVNIINILKKNILLYLQTSFDSNDDHIIMIDIIINFLIATLLFFLTLFFFPSLIFFNVIIHILTYITCLFFLIPLVLGRNPNGNWELS